MRDSKKPVAVLGCGPAGLLAAWAAECQGAQVHVYSVKKASPIGGAQYLHRAIPGMTDPRPDAMLAHRVEGDAFTYQRKAYGNGPQPDFVSFAHVTDGLLTPCWNLRDTYTRLWERYEPFIDDQAVTSSWITEHHNDFRKVVVAVPKKAVCVYHDPAKRDEVAGTGMHHFAQQGIQILNRCMPSLENNSLYYNGGPSATWYRASLIFGTGSTEWGPGIKLPFPAHEVVQVYKPVSTTCTCWSNNGKVMFVGRFGKWRKGELAHHAYDDVMDVLA